MPSKKTTSSLADLASKRESSGVTQTVDIDISRWYGEGAVLTLRRPKLADKWNALRTRLKFIKAQKPDWPDELCAVVAGLASSHVSPDAGREGPIPFYIGLADHDDDSCFNHVQAEFNGAFTAPPAEESNEEDAAALLRYCCLEYLHRHPEEIGELSAEAVSDLFLHYREKMKERLAMMNRLGPLATLLGLGN